MIVKRKIKIPAVLKAINVLLLLAIICFYTYRLIHHYRLENKVKNPNEKIYLVDKILKKESLVDLTKGLVRDEETNIYSYKGEVNDNYLYYSGLMYRIVGIDNESNIKLVTDEVVSLLPFGMSKNYEESHLNNWLNNTDKDYSGVFFKNLYNDGDYLENTYNCFDDINELTDIKCEKFNNDFQISTISLNDYVTAGGTKSYLNNNSSWGLLNKTENAEMWYVNKEGNVALSPSISKALGVRPVITINKKIEYKKGDGSKSNPYIIYEKAKEKTSDLEVGDYIQFSGYNWRVVNNSNNLKIVMDGYLLENDEPLLKSFSTEKNIFNTGKNTLGEYLNNAFYKSLQDSSFVLKSNWHIGKINTETYNYESIYKDKVENYIGLLNFSEMFVNEYNEVFTLTPSPEATNVIFTINESGSLYGDFVTTENKIRPSLVIKDDIKIESGKGSKTNPYVIGGQND